MATEYPSGFPAPSGGGLVTAVGGIRKDVGAVIADTDGDYGPLQTDAVGNLRVTEEGGKLTYSMAFTGLVGAASCTDLVRLSGSATKSVYVQEIRISATATAAKTLDILLVKRSTANSGGTSSAGVAIPHSSDDAAGSAAGLLYTANPTVGTATGNLRATRYTIPAVDGAADLCPELVYDLRGHNGGKGVRLEGVAQGLCINLSGASPGSGNSFAGSITYTEEPLTA